MLTAEEPFDLFSSDAHLDHFRHLAPGLRDVIRKGSAYLQNARYPSADELRFALEETLGQLPDDPDETNPLASNTLINRFRSGSLSGLTSNLESIEASNRDSMPTFDTDSLAKRAVAKRAPLGRDEHDSIVREQRNSVQLAAANPAEKSGFRISGQTLSALGLVGFLGTLLIIMMVMMVMMVYQQPVTVGNIGVTELDKSANVGLQNSSEGALNHQLPWNMGSAKKVLGSEEVVGNSATLDPPIAEEMEQAPIVVNTKSTTANATDETQKSSTEAATSGGKTKRTGNANRNNIAAPTGKVRIRCRPGCEIKIKSKAKKDSKVIHAKDEFIGRVTVGNNRITLTSSDGQIKADDILISTVGSQSLCWDFTTQGRCKNTESTE
jgi:hypothetical protein